MSATDSNIHFRILEDISRDLSGEVNFPTCMDAAIMVRNTLKNPDANLNQVADVVGIEPLIASKLLRLANSVTYNPAGKPISDLRVAISRLGFQSVRATSLAVAMDQMLKSRNLAGFDQIGKLTWEHSLQVAAIAKVLAKRIGRLNTEEAMLAGLIHEIGTFYLLYRAAEYPEYREHPEEVLSLIKSWHESIGESLLYILGLPEPIIEAVRNHHRPPPTDAPCTLADALHFANILAGNTPEWMVNAALAEASAASGPQREAFADLLDEAQEQIQEIRAALAG